MGVCNGMSSLCKRGPSASVLRVRLPTETGASVPASGGLRDRSPDQPLANVEDREKTHCVSPRLLGPCLAERGGWSRRTWLVGREPPDSVLTSTFWALAGEKVEVGPESRGWSG